jgi:hypothetical protein
VSDPAFLQRESIITMDCRVRIAIKAPPKVIWELLTDAEGFPRWNSTVTRIEGRIAEGQRLRIHASGTKRIFTPRVSGVLRERRMVWSDGIPLLFKGTRIFALEPHVDGSTEFAMEETFSGLIFALVKRTMPDFRPIFEAYANDLRREAERLARQHNTL